MLGDGGAGLSAWQRQRLAIAWLLVASADLIILDESTSALNGTADAYLRHEIREIFPRQFILLVSHSAEWQAVADRVVHMQGGRVLRPIDVASPFLV